MNTPKFREPLRQAKARLAATDSVELPERVDHRNFCSPIENQETLGSCTAHAVVGMLEYMIKRGLGEAPDLARLFLYKVSRRLLGWTGDSGAYIRATIKAAASFGVPPEQYYPYDITRFDEEPDAFLYSYAANFKALQYARLDTYNSTGDETLKAVKQALVAAFAVAFGFPVYNSISTSPYVPFPSAKDQLQGGHAVLAVGYDNAVKIKEDDDTTTDEGCLIIRNSWGPSWGDQGYGYLPYKYVQQGLAVDFWAVYRSEWLQDKTFS